ncbi:MAG: class I tRNA ligase family protein, partial [Lutibacter sp.]|nr:class I tRNA ligase family protein [Lutibacter sp.]
EFSDIDNETLEKMYKFPSIIGNSIDRYRFREASQELLNLARLGNKYLADEEPWKMIKVDEERVKTVMYVALQIASALAILSEPFLPFTSEKLKGILNIASTPLSDQSDSQMSTANDQIDSPLSGVEGWNDVEDKDELLPPNHQIGKGELLFAKIEDEEIQAQLDRLEATKLTNEAENKIMEPQKPIIEFDDFTKLDIRVGTIVEAIKVPKTKKLLQLKVDVGIDVRTIVSGIAESFNAEEIIGQKVTVLVNLAPRNLKGIDSMGMILMTNTPDGKLAFIEPESDSVANGKQVS